MAFSCLFERARSLSPRLVELAVPQRSRGTAEVARVRRSRKEREKARGLERRGGGASEVAVEEEKRDRKPFAADSGLCFFSSFFPSSLTREKKATPSHLKPHPFLLPEQKKARTRAGFFG